MGLAFDGEHLWNDEAFSHWFAHVDTGGHLISTFNPTYGNRDMTFDGTYLWATDWQQEAVYKYDTSTCAILSSFPAPFTGKAHGMAWDGIYLWIGQEGGQIWQVDTSGNVIRWIPSPYTNYFNPRGLAFDGQNLWVGAQSIGLIYEIDTLAGTVIASYAAPSGDLQQGLTFDGQFLWSTGGDNYIYRIDIGLGIEEEEEALTTNFSLKNWPNPFSQQTTIEFSLSSACEVGIEIFDNGGRFIERIEKGTRDAGNHSIQWKRKDLHAGIYFVILKTGQAHSSVKLLILD
jgi:hypothetical protein